MYTDHDVQDVEEAFNRVSNEEEGAGYVNYGSTGSSEDLSAANAFGFTSAYENPSNGQHHSPQSFNNPEVIEMVQFNSEPIEQENSLVRRNVQSVQSSTEGIEHLLEDMPSRTVGRKQGAKLAGYNGTVRRLGTVRGRKRLASIQQENVVATEVFEEIGADGQIDNSELREIPCNMALKKMVRAKVKEKENLEKSESQSVGCFSLWKFKLALKWRHFKDDLYKSISSWKLWNYHLKKIEGKFGSGVLSYFTFLRGIFLLSLPSFLLSFLFISVPQLFEPPEYPACSFTGEALLTGANCFTNTIMYHGYYINSTINVIGNAYYNMPLAYIFATLGYFLLCLMWLIRSTGILYRKNYIDAKADGSSFFPKVFCSWDFGTTSQKTAELRHETITSNLKEAVSEQVQKQDHRSFCEKFEVFLLRIVSWTFYFGIVGGSLTLIYFVNKSFICDIQASTQRMPILQSLLLPIIVSVINLIFPYVITFITHLEKYKHRRHELYISVLRNFVFKTGILVMICVFWTTSGSSSENCDVQGNETKICWETELGQEIYRLVIVDFIFSMIFATFCAEYLLKVFSKMLGKKKPEFSIANNVMDLIYGQMLCWIGVYFTPLLALINMIKYFILFYVKMISALKNCRASTRSWRAAQSQTLFNTMQLISFILSGAFLTYVVFNETPSESCGPFRGQTRAYEVVVEVVDELANTKSGAWLAGVLRALTNVWVLDSIVIIILVIVLFARSRAVGLEKLGGTLKDQIRAEGKDKALLLEWLKELTERQRTPTTKIVPLSSNKEKAGDALLAPAVYNDSDLDTIDDSGGSMF